MLAKVPLYPMDAAFFVPQCWVCTLFTQLSPEVLTAVRSLSTVQYCLLRGWVGSSGARELGSSRAWVVGGTARNVCRPPLLPSHRLTVSIPALSVSLMLGKLIITYASAW